MPDFEAIGRSIYHAPAAHAFAAFVGAVVIGVILARIFRALFLRVSKRTRVTWDDALSRRLAGPASALIALQLYRIALDYLDVPPRPLHLLDSAIGVFTILVVVWAIFRSIDLVRDVIEERAWARNHPSSRSLLALSARFVKGAMFVLGLLVALSHLGVSVASLVAGLGIGGLALALAAQKTVENLFGALSIGIDQPLREGDYIKVGEVQGTVEQIGLRSTRIRTLDRTIVTIPNGELSNQRIESMTRRDRFRLFTIIGLEYGTTAAQLRDIVAKIEAILRAQPKIWPSDLTVKLTKFAASSLDIEVQAWFQTVDGVEFNQLRQDMLLAFMDAIEGAGAEMAFPTQTLHVASAPPLDMLGPEEKSRSQPRSSGSAPAS